MLYVIQKSKPLSCIANYMKNVFYSIFTFGLLFYPASCFAQIECDVRKQYMEGCFSCEIVTILINAFVTAGGKAYNVSRQLGNTILLVGTALWLAWYILRSVSSFTSVEPAKMIQDIVIQLFKVLTAYVVVNAGIEIILEYTLNPIMIAGTDFGKEILNTLEGRGKAS